MLASVAASVIALTSPAISTPATGEGYAFPLNILSGPLDGALQDLARQTGVELLFDRTMLRGLRAPRLKTRMTIEAALKVMLAGTELVARRSATGAWVVERRAMASVPAEDLAEPEILVIGHRTQNLDIRRRENDVQPYQVSTRSQIVNAHRNDLEQFFRSRVGANTQVVPSSYAQTGSTNSQIDLRGLGTDQTLILVDGRRLPGVPQGALSFVQPDINAIPLNAIERVETLTGTAGGIYGFGALGGVVNIVTRRDLHGLELHGTAGISARGDAGRISLEGGFGFSPDGGDTDVSLYVAHSREQALRQGQRDYALSARRFVNARLPNEFSGLGNELDSNAVNVFALGFLSDSLIFKPEFGGASLDSSKTYLPRGFSGSQADMIAALTQRAGQIDLTLSDERNASDLGSTPTKTSAILSLRHRFGDGTEAYFDALLLRNYGRFHSLTSDGEVILSPSSALNPFTDYIWVTFPAPPSPQDYAYKLASSRYTAGLIVPLPHRWKAIAEATFGSVQVFAKGAKKGYLNYIGIDDDPGFDPFGDWDALQRGLEAYTLDTGAAYRARSRHYEQSLRLSGPLWRTAAGPASVTLLAQNRIEDVPSFQSIFMAELYDFEPMYSDTTERSSTTRSLHAEIDTPLIAADAPVPLLRGLEVQLAARYDTQSFSFSLNPSDPDSEKRHVRFAGTTFTAGVKLLPLPWLMLRGSYATGLQPPPLDDLIEYTFAPGFYTRADTRRGNELADKYLVKTSGSPSLEAIRASTLALGVILNPDGKRAPRVSFDYSHIRRTGDPVALDQGTILAHEELWPERVTRLPLTDADRALGYTVGAITAVDARMMNAGRLDVESIDGKLDWTLPFVGGTLRVYGSGTLQLRNSIGVPFQPSENLVGFRGGPLRWRGNGGLEWTAGRLLLGTNLQYFNRYRVATSDKYLCCSGGTEILQGSRYVKAQTYLDLYASRRFRVAWGGLESEFSVDLGMVNILDTRPPYDALNAFVGEVPMYSPYGDPRRRRFELGINARF